MQIKHQEMQDNDELPDDTYETDLFIASQENIPIEVADGLPPEFGTDDYNNDPRLDEERAVLESKQDEIARRRDIIETRKARHPSTSHSELVDLLKANGIHVTMSTVSRDCAEIDQATQGWADSQLTGGLVGECKQIVIRFKEMIDKMETAMEDASPRDKPNYVKQIHELSMSILDVKKQASFEAIKIIHKKYGEQLSSPEAQRKQAEFNT